MEQLSPELSPRCQNLVFQIGYYAMVLATDKLNQEWAVIYQERKTELEQKLEDWIKEEQDADHNPNGTEWSKWD